MSAAPLNHRRSPRDFVRTRGRRHPDRGRDADFVEGATRKSWSGAQPRQPQTRHASTSRKTMRLFSPTAFSVRAPSGPRTTHQFRQRPTSASQNETVRLALAALSKQRQLPSNGSNRDTRHSAWVDDLLARPCVYKLSSSISTTRPNLAEPFPAHWPIALDFVHILRIYTEIVRQPVIRTALR